MPEPRDTDALAAIAALAARLRETAAAVAERADSAARSGPLSGFHPGSTGGRRPEGDHDAATEDADGTWGSADFGAIIDFAAMLRESVPDDLRDRLSDSFRETLLSTRALIDWYLERDAGTTPDDTLDGETVDEGS